MAKTRVGVLLRESVGGKASLNNQRTNLNKLEERYGVFCKRIRALISSLQGYHAAMVHIDKTRTQVALHLGLFTSETPLFECTGLMPSADRPSNTVCSYASVHDVMSSKTKSYADKYKQYVLDYVVEWEKIVTTRINNGLKKAEDMRRELDHYQKKVEAMRLSANQTLVKGKQVRSETAEKLKRNEEKLLQAKQDYNKVATALCLLMEEITERSWRDLHHVLLKIVQFDSALSSDEAKALLSLDKVERDLKQVATAHGISPQHRLKDMASLNPDLLTTRPGGVVGFAIEAESWSMSPTGSSATAGSSPDRGTNGIHNSSMAQPPGSVAPQGLGGFPVTLSGTGDYSSGAALGRAGSFHSQTSGYASAPPTMGGINSGSSAYDPPMNSLGMLSLTQATAPAPTLEDVYSSGHFSSNSNLYGGGGANSTALTIRSAPASGNLPPMHPSGGGGSMHGPSLGGGGMNYRSSSFNDGDSMYSGMSGGGGGYSGGGSSGHFSLPGPLPPSMPPPPPPSMPPPPPPAASFDQYRSSTYPGMSSMHSLSGHQSMGGPPGPYGGGLSSPPPPPLGMPPDPPSSGYGSGWGGTGGGPSPLRSDPPSSGGGGGYGQRYPGGGASPYTPNSTSTTGGGGGGTNPFDF